MNPDEFRDNKRTALVRAAYLREMFARIAPRYDLINRLMTAGQDLRWRKEVIRRAKLMGDCRLLDLGTGTGDLAREAIRQQPSCEVIAADFSLEMMSIGRRRLKPQLYRNPSWCAADALSLPFPGDRFDAVVSGFLMRNVGQIEGCLQEQRRVLVPGGRLVILDTTRPKSGFFTPLVQIHLKRVIPSLGRFLSGQADAYTYLPDSTKGFLSAEGLAACLVSAGFHQVGFRRLMFGTIAIHWAQKNA